MIQYKVEKYTPADSMSELICGNYPMLLVMSRFGIDLGFGDDSIGEACEKNGVDTYTFLTVANLLIKRNKINRNKEALGTDYSQISLPSLIKYLHNSHSYFLEFRLPLIRKELVGALDGGSDVSFVILNYFDEYVAEVHKHMMYEENMLFPYINSVICGDPIEYSIEAFSKHHDKVETKLSELKKILIKYYPVKTTNELNNVLYDIFSCERDLASHNNIEDFLLVPTMKVFETTKR
ncbi:MAG: hemerythrin domain-containing protein [Rikenellaceae bacterium]